MNNELEFKESLWEVYTQETITNMIKIFEEAYNLNFSDEVFEDLKVNAKDEIYTKTALEIQVAMKIYKEHSWKDFVLAMNDEEQIINNQLADFHNNTPESNVLSIVDGSDYKEKTVDTRSWVKKFVDKVLSIIPNKKS